MATYIMLNSFTEQGIKNVKDLPGRVKSARQTLQSMGAKVKDFYAVMGMAHKDTLIIFEAPDDETAAKAAVSIGMLGFVRTQTVRAFTEEEIKKILASLP